MDFNVSADPPQVVDFRKEVAAWMAEQFKGHEHLRWSASWSTREDADEYKFRRGLARVRDDTERGHAGQPAAPRGCRVGARGRRARPRARRRRSP